MPKVDSRFPEVPMTRKSLLLCVFLLLSIGVVAGVSATDAPSAVRAAILKLAPPGTSIGDITAAPMPGFYQALVGGRMVYVSASGRYVMDGRLYDASAGRDLTKTSMNRVRRQALATVPDSERIIFAPPHPKYTVTVFTDLDCAYCRALHHHIAQFNRDGIAVQYLFWPRTGLKAVPSGKPTPSYLKAVSVWCSPDRKAEFTAAKLGHDPKPATCPNPIAAEFHLGERIGVDGTPTIVASDGTLLGGYMTPDQLLQALQELKLQHAPSTVGR